LQSDLQFALDLKAALDLAVWAMQKLGFDPDSWQAEVLRSSNKRILLNCSRQSGKSTITSVLALHTATYQPGSLILCLSLLFAKAESCRNE
jgi:hypothetical protein